MSVSSAYNQDVISYQAQKSQHLKDNLQIELQKLQGAQRQVQRLDSNASLMFEMSPSNREKKGVPANKNQFYSSFLHANAQANNNHGNASPMSPAMSNDGFSNAHINNNNVSQFSGRKVVDNGQNHFNSNNNGVVSGFDSPMLFSAANF